MSALVIVGCVITLIVVIILWTFLSDLHINPDNLVQDVTTKHLYLDMGPPGFSRIPFFKGTMYSKQRRYVGVRRISRNLPLYMNAVSSKGSNIEFIDFPGNFVAISHSDAFAAELLRVKTK